MQEVKRHKSRLFGHGFWMMFAHGLGDRWQRLTYTDEELIVSLGNSLKLHEQAIRESKSLWGRFLDLFVRPTDPESIEIDGMRLQQLFALARSTPPVEIKVSQSYVLEVARLRTLLQSATDRQKTLTAGTLESN